MLTSPQINTSLQISFGAESGLPQLFLGRRRFCQYWTRVAPASDRLLRFLSLRLGSNGRSSPAAKQTSTLRPLETFSNSKKPQASAASPITFRRPINPRCRDLPMVQALIPDRSEPQIRLVTVS